MCSPRRIAKRLSNSSRSDFSITFYSTFFTALTSNSKDTFVRLGDQNIRSRNDGLSGVDIPVAEFIKHEEYTKRTKQNDIALVRLARPAKISNFVRPACLWGESSISQSSVTATGWGFTEYSGSSSDELLKVQLNILDNNVCSEALAESGFVLNQNHICAGVLSGGKDTCQGGEYKICSSNIN